MNISKHSIVSTLVTSLLALPLSVSADRGIDRVSIVTIQAVRTADSTSAAGDALITVGEVLGTVAVAAAATVLTGGAALAAGAAVETATMAAEVSADVAVAGAQVASDSIDKSGDPDDLIAHFRAFYAEGNVSHDLQHADRKSNPGSDSPRSTKPGQIIKVPGYFALNVVRNSNPAHSSYRYATLKLTEYDSGSANDDLGTLNIPSYSYMNVFGKQHKGTTVKFINDKTYVASTTLHSPASGDDNSIYQITYMVETDGGKCSALTRHQHDDFKAKWNPEEIYCPGDY